MIQDFSSHQRKRAEYEAKAQSAHQQRDQEIKAHAAELEQQIEKYIRENSIPEIDITFERLKNELILTRPNSELTISIHKTIEEILGLSPWRYDLDERHTGWPGRIERTASNLDHSNMNEDDTINGVCDWLRGS